MAPQKRSFSGCWTCRVRKIKCGLERPACTRCVKTGLECGGYDIKLRWAKPLTVSPTTGDVTNAAEVVDDEGQQRRNVAFVTFPMLQVYRLFSELDAAVLATDSVEWGQVTLDVDGWRRYRQGPFGVWGLGRIVDTPQGSVTSVKSERRSLLATSKPRPAPPSRSSARPHKPSQSPIRPSKSSHSPTRPSKSSHSPIRPSKSSRVAFDPVSGSHPVSDSRPVPGFHPKVTPSTPVVSDGNRQSAWIHLDLLSDAELTVRAMRGPDHNPTRWSGSRAYYIEQLFPNYYRAPPLHSSCFTDVAHDETQPHLRVLLHRVPVPEFQILWGNPAVEGDSSYSLTVSPVFRRLLGFFPSVTRNFMVHPFEGNVWDTIVLPIVDRIAGEVLTSESPILHHAVLNQALCLSAVVWLRLPNKSREERDLYLLLGIRLRNLAHKQITQDSLRGEVSLLALLLQIRVDNLFGIFDYLGEYFKRCGELVGPKATTRPHAPHAGPKSVPGPPRQSTPRGFRTRPPPGSHAEAEGWNRRKKHATPPPSPEPPIDPSLLALYRCQRTFFDSTRAVGADFQIDEELYPDIGPLYTILRDMYETLAELKRGLSHASVHIDYTVNREKEPQTPTAMFDIRRNFPLDRSLELRRGGTGSALHAGYTPDSCNAPPPSLSINFAADPDSGSESSGSESSGCKVVISLNNSAPLDTSVSLTQVSARATAVEIPVGVERSPFHPEPLVNLLYGIPLTLLSLFLRIIALANHRYTFNLRKVFPRNFPRLCADTEDELFSWTPNWHLYDSIYDVKTEKRERKFLSEVHEVIYHGISSFHHGLVVYFCRLINDTPPLLLQDHVVACLQHMEALLSLKAADTLPHFWQYFVCGSDAIEPDIQDRYTRWFKAYDGLTNHWRARQVMAEVWRRRAADDGDVCWIDVVKDWDWVLFFG